jgi:hypothetical protein
MKTISSKFYALLSILFIPSIALADSNPLNGLSNVAKKAGYSASTNQTTISSIAGVLVATVLSLLGIVFIVLIIYAGVTWMTAEGDESKVEKAQTTMRNAVIGLIITIGVYGIYALIQALAFPIN